MLLHLLLDKHDTDIQINADDTYNTDSDSKR